MTTSTVVKMDNSMGCVMNMGCVNTDNMCTLRIISRCNVFIFNSCMLCCTSFNQSSFLLKDEYGEFNAKSIMLLTEPRKCLCNY